MILNIEFLNNLGFIITLIGILGILKNNKNLIITIIAIELTFYGVNFLLVIYAFMFNSMSAQILALIVLTIAAAESAVALALITSFFKIYRNIIISSFNK